MYQKLMEKADSACIKAIEFFRKGDLIMSAFWKKASIGFKQKAENLAIETVI